jgi:hypothetical protein
MNARTMVNVWTPASVDPGRSCRRLASRERAQSAALRPVGARLCAALLVLGACGVFAPPASPQEFFPLRDFDWYEPLTAEQRAARIAATFGTTDRFEYSVESGRRFVWDIHLGKEIPVVALVGAVNPDAFNSGEWAIGLWAPVSFHMIEDFKDPSSPIVNTDYRFGAMLKARYAFRSERWLAARFVPWAHESTHLGDEFSLTARERFPGFERINVSYEYWEYGIGYETPRWSVRHGGLKPWGKDGYYSAKLLEPGQRQIPLSRRNFEPSFGLEYRHPTGAGWGPFASVETRNRIIYDYHKASSSVPEERQWSWSVAVGAGTAPAAAGPATLALSHIYLRFYYGVNPHGQLRNNPNYTMVGVGLNFRVK